MQAQNTRELHIQRTKQGITTDNGPDTTSSGTTTIKH